MQANVLIRNCMRPMYHAGRDYQKTIERLVRSLQIRGYSTWFDVDCMKGSTMDAMRWIRTYSVFLLLKIFVP